jgi:hypothetical protein
MSRYTGPRLRIIRRLGTPIPGLMRTDPDLRRPYPPGQHGPTKRKKLSDYALRLMEKQKLRFHYGLSEKQLRKYVAMAFSGKGNSGHVLLQILERRLRAPRLLTHQGQHGVDAVEEKMRPDARLQRLQPRFRERRRVGTQVQSEVSEHERGGARSEQQRAREALTAQIAEALH